ncbi:MAG: hypothetical protein II289_00175 [Bacteroidales bacterium]|nr:hypothetical protein [Bacteroidales bacterium]
MASKSTYLATATLLSLVVSCAVPKVVLDQRDSTVIHIKDSIRFRDSLILVPIPQGEDKAKLPDTDTSFLQTSVAESEAFVKDGVLHHSLRNRSEAVIPIRITIPERIRTEEKGLTRYLKQVERIEVEKELSRWQRFLQGLGWTALIAVVLWIINKVRQLVV